MTGCSNLSSRWPPLRQTLLFATFVLNQLNISAQIAETPITAPQNVGRATKFDTKHFRCLLFPVDETQPRFIWMHHHHHDDRPDDLIVDRHEVKTHVAGSPSDGDMHFDCHRELKRQYANRLCVWHDNNMQGNKHARNAYLHALLGDKTADWQPDRWKGSFLVTAVAVSI
jgi:hypothetical protein